MLVQLARLFVCQPFTYWELWYHEENGDRKLSPVDMLSHHSSVFMVQCKDKSALANLIECDFFNFCNHGTCAGRTGDLAPVHNASLGPPKLPMVLRAAHVLDGPLLPPHGCDAVPYDVENHTVRYNHYGVDRHTCNTDAAMVIASLSFNPPEPASVSAWEWRMELCERFFFRTPIEGEHSSRVTRKFKDVIRKYTSQALLSMLPPLNDDIDKLAYSNGTRSISKCFNGDTNLPLAYLVTKYVIATTGGKFLSDLMSELLRGEDKLYRGMEIDLMLERSSRSRRLERLTPLLPSVPWPHVYTKFKVDSELIRTRLVTILGCTDKHPAPAPPAPAAAA